MLRAVEGGGCAWFGVGVGAHEQLCSALRSGSGRKHKAEGESAGKCIDRVGAKWKTQQLQLHRLFLRAAHTGPCRKLGSMESVLARPGGFLSLLDFRFCTLMAVLGPYHVRHWSLLWPQESQRLAFETSDLKLC